MKMGKIGGVKMRVGKTTVGNFAVGMMIVKCGTLRPFSCWRPQINILGTGH